MSHANSKKLRLLVADDAPFIREIVRHVCDANNIEVVGEASDGEEAVALALSLRPDIVLMDLIMPRKSGIDATCEIKAANPAQKIIAFSTADQEIMVIRAIEAGCFNFLVKPFKAEELLEKLAKVTKEQLDVQK